LFFKAHKSKYNPEEMAVEIQGLGAFDLSSSMNRQKAADVIKEKLKLCTEIDKKRLINALANVLKVKKYSGARMALSWPQVKEMSTNGVDFGAHGDTHGILSNMPLWEARKEIIFSKKIIEEQLGKPVTSFAYPNGGYNKEIVSLLSNSGFACGVTTHNKIINQKNNYNLYELPRITGTIENFSKFKAVSSGLYLDLCALKNK